MFTMYGKQMSQYFQEPPAAVEILPLNVNSHQQGIVEVGREHSKSLTGDGKITRWNCIKTFTCSQISVEEGNLWGGNAGLEKGPVCCWPVLPQTGAGQRCQWCFVLL